MVTLDKEIYTSGSQELLIQHIGVGYFRDCGIFETFIAERLVLLANYFPLQTLRLRLNIFRIEDISLQPAIIKKSVTQNKVVGRRH